jgi:hypothetical protein
MIDLSHEDEAALETLLRFLYWPKWKVQVAADGSTARNLVAYAVLHDMSKRYSVPQLARLAALEFKSDLVDITWSSSADGDDSTLILPCLVGLVYDESKDNAALRELLVEAVSEIVDKENLKAMDKLEKAFAISPKFALDLVVTLDDATVESGDEATEEEEDEDDD